MPIIAIIDIIIYCRARSGTLFFAFQRAPRAAIDVFRHELITLFTLRA